MFVFVQLFMRFLQEQRSNEIGNNQCWRNNRSGGGLAASKQVSAPAELPLCFSALLLLPLYSALLLTPAPLCPPAPHLLCPCALLCSTSAPAPAPQFTPLSPYASRCSPTYPTFPPSPAVIYSLILFLSPSPSLLLSNPYSAAFTH